MPGASSTRPLVPVSAWDRKARDRLPGELSDALLDSFFRQVRQRDGRRGLAAVTGVQLMVSAWRAGIACERAAARERDGRR